MNTVACFSLTIWGVGVTLLRGDRKQLSSASLIHNLADRDRFTVLHTGALLECDEFTPSDTESISRILFKLTTLFRTIPDYGTIDRLLFAACMSIQAPAAAALHACIHTFFYTNVKNPSKLVSCITTANNIAKILTEMPEFNSTCKLIMASAREMIGQSLFKVRTAAERNELFSILFFSKLLRHLNYYDCSTFTSICIVVSVHSLHQ